MKALRPFLRFLAPTMSCIFFVAVSPSLHALSTNQILTTQAPVAERQTRIGADTTFDIASVKSNKSDAPTNSVFPLGSGDGFVPTGGLFVANNEPLVVYITFAYKVRESDLVGLRPWVYDDRFDIEARSEGNPTKDQFRLMMRELLADRFKLAVHAETKQGPVYALELSKRGKIGPKLQRNTNACATEAEPQEAPAAPGSLPSAPRLQLPSIPCGSVGPIPASGPDRGRLGGRAVNISRIASSLKSPYTGVDRPVIDHTGLLGTFDFSLEWSLTSSPLQPPISAPKDDTGPIFLEALKDQLGLKLDPQKGPVDVLVIDHIEEPSPN